MQREALRIAMAKTPDFRLGALPSDEGIVRRHRAVRPDANDLAEVVGKILRLIPLGEMLAQRQEEIVVESLRDAAAEMIAARERTVLMEDHADVGEPWRALLEEPRTRERRAPAAAHGLGIAEIEGVILRIGAVESDVVQTALTR